MTKKDLFKYFEKELDLNLNDEYSLQEVINKLETSTEKLIKKREEKTKKIQSELRKNIEKIYSFFPDQSKEYKNNLEKLGFHLDYKSHDIESYSIKLLNKTDYELVLDVTFQYSNKGKETKSYLNIGYESEPTNLVLPKDFVFLKEIIESYKNIENSVNKIVNR